MPSFTVETIERLDLSQVLSEMQKKVKAEAALEAQAKRLGVSEADLKKAILATNQANAASIKAAEQAAKAWAREDAALTAAVTAELKAAERQIAKEERLAAAAEKAAARKAEAEQKYLTQVRMRSLALEAADERQRETAAAAAVLSRQVRGAGESASSARAAYVNFGNQLADVAVQAQAGTNPFTILIQQGPQVGAAMAQSATLTATLTSALAVLGPTAAGVAVVGAPLLAWSKALDEQNAKTVQTTQALIAANKLLAEGGQSVVDIQADLAKRMMLLSGDVGAGQVRTMEANAEAAAAYEKQIKGLNATLRTFEQQLADVENGADSFLEAAFGPSGVERAMQADALRAKIDDLRKTLKDTNAEQELTAATLDLVKTGEDALKDATKQANKHLKEQRDLLAEAGEARERAILRDREIMDEWSEWQKEDNETFAKVLEAREKMQKEAVDAWVNGLLKQQEAEQKAAAASAAAASMRRDALMGVTSELASNAADAFSAESAVAKAAAAIQIAIAEYEVIAKAATLGPIAGPIYAVAGTASVALAASKLDALNTDVSGAESYSDTPSMQRRSFGPNGGLVRFAPGDVVDFAAARREQDLNRQTGGGATTVQTAIKLQVNGRTAQTIQATATSTRRGRDPGSPVPGRRRIR